MYATIGARSGHHSGHLEAGKGLPRDLEVRGKAQLTLIALRLPHGIHSCCGVRLAFRFFIEFSGLYTEPSKKAAVSLIA